MFRFLFFSFLLFLPCIHFSQNILTLEDAIRLGLQHNFDILLVKNTLEAAKANNIKANAGMLPRVNASISDNYSNSNILQRFSNGSEINRNFISGNNLNAGVTGSLTLFDGYRMYATKKRLEELELLGEINIKSQVQNTVAAIITAYFGIVSQEQQLRTIEELIKLSEERVRIADNKFRVGTSSKMDVLQSNIDLNVQKSSILRQQNAIRQSKVALNILLAQATDADFEVQKDIVVDYKPTIESIRVAMVEQNPQMEAISKNIRISELVLKENKGLKLPTIILSSGLMTQFSQSQAGFSLFNLNYGLNVGFTASMPIYDGGNIKRLEALAKIDIKQQQIQYDRLKYNLEQGVVRATNDFKVAVEVMQLEEANIGIARENSMIALERFRLNQSNNSLELKEAQRSLEEAQIRLITARYNAKIAETELKRLTGTLAY